MQVKRRPEAVGSDTLENTTLGSGPPWSTSPVVNFMVNGTKVAPVWSVNPADTSNWYSVLPASGSSGVRMIASPPPVVFTRDEIGWRVGSPARYRRTLVARAVGSSVTPATLGRLTYATTKPLTSNPVEPPTGLVARTDGLAVA